MGESSRRKHAAFGDRAKLIEGEMRIVRFNNGSSGKRVEFYLDRMTNEDAYASISAIKEAFERRLGFGARPGEPQQSPTISAADAFQYRAVVIPYSSVVGQSVGLLDETGAQVAQINIHGVSGDTPEERGAASRRLAELIAKALNSSAARLGA